MSNPTPSRPPRQRNPLPAVAGSVRLVQPVGTVGEPEELMGEIAISGKSYSLRILPRGYQLCSFDERRQDMRCYDIPTSLAVCECLDFLGRADLRADGKCKHLRALGALVGAGKIPQPVFACTVCGGSGYRSYETEFSSGLCRCTACEGGEF